MLGVLRHTGDGLNLRRICQRFDGVTYHDRMLAAITYSGAINANGGLNGRGVSWTEFHPTHAMDDPIEIAKYHDQSEDDFGRMSQSIMGN